MSTGLDTTYEELKFKTDRKINEEQQRLDTTYEELKYSCYGGFGLSLLGIRYYL